MAAADLAIPLEDIPVRLRCSMCNNLAQNAYRLPCCEQSICGNCQSKLPSVCQICDHTPLNAEDCKVHSSLRTTVTIFLRTAEKKYGTLNKAKKESTPIPAVQEKDEQGSGNAVAAEPTKESVDSLQEDGGSADKAVDQKIHEVVQKEEPDSIGAGESTQLKEINGNIASGALDSTNSNQNQGHGSGYWNGQHVMNQYQNGNQGFNSGNNMAWNGYDQTSGYGMQNQWGMPNMMDQSGNMGSFNGMQSFSDGYNGMANMGYNGYNQGGYGNTGMGIQGQGNWGNGWNMQGGVDGSSFNSSGMNAGFYPGAGGFNHQSYGNHQSQQSHMMPHQQFQSRGYHHNQFRNNSNQSMRGAYGQQQQHQQQQQQQQQQFNGPRNKSIDQQLYQPGNELPNSQAANGGDQNDTAALGQSQLDARVRGESSEKVLVDHDSSEASGNKDPSSSMNSETNGATGAISSIDIKDEIPGRGDHEPTDSASSVSKVAHRQSPHPQGPPVDVEQQTSVPGIVGAPTGPRAMRERPERGRGRGRGGGYFSGPGRGGHHQTQISGSDDFGHSRTDSIASTGRGGTGAVLENGDYVNASRRQSRADEGQFSPVETRKEYDSHDRDKRRSRSRSRTRRHRHHRSRSRKRSSSPKPSRGASRDKSRSRSRDRKRHRDGDKDKDRERERDKERGHKEGSRSHRSSHKSSSHKHRRDRSRSRSRTRKDKDHVEEIDVKDVDSKSRNRDGDGDERRKDKDSNRDERRRDSDKKSRKRSRSRHRSHRDHKRSRGDGDEKADKVAHDPERKTKSSRSARRHSTRYEDEESAAERERRVEREREEERWGKR